MRSDRRMADRIGGHVAADAAFTTKTAVALAASAIPIVGGPISTAIGIWEGERISRRVESFVDEIRVRMTKLNVEKLDRDYIDGDGFKDAVISAVQAAKRSSAKGKREWVAALLIGAATTDRPPDLDAEALLDTLAGLTERELHILRWVWTHKNKDGTFHSASLPAHLQGPDYNFHLRRLESAGMVGYKADRPTTGSDDWRIFGITETFHRLMALIAATGGLSEPVA
jgi:hypothetical protein